MLEMTREGVNVCSVYLGSVFAATTSGLSLSGRGARAMRMSRSTAAGSTPNRA
jgi:hypothetical protein